MASTKDKTIRQSVIPGMLVAPSVLFILGVMGFPMAYSLWRSLIGKGQFVGLANYVKILSDPSISDAIWRTLLFVVVCTACQLLLGLCYALLLNRDFFGKGFVRALYLLPLLVPPVVGALNWSWLLNSQFGLVNQIIREITGSFTGPMWLVEPALAFISVSIATIWRNTPFSTVLFLAGLQAIDPDMYEAASIDGCSTFQAFRYITLPSLKYVATITAMLTIIDLYRVFDVIFVMTQGGPGGATEVLTTRVYKLAFWEVQMGQASSLAYIALILTLITLTPLLIMSRKAGEV